MENDRSIMNMVNDYFSKDDLVNEYNERVKRGLLEWEKTVARDYMMPPGSVLDVGCGSGREAFELYDLGYKVTGVDLSEKQIEQARKNAAQFGKDIDFMVCDGINYEFDDNTFDYVLIWQQVLGNVPTRKNRINVLKEAKRVLKPCGKIIVSVHSYEYCMPLAEKRGLFIKAGEEKGDVFLKEPYDNVCYWHYFTKDEFEGHFTEAGINIIRCGYAPDFGMDYGWITTMICIGEKN
jgi:SAM-dependent methyltransferase